MSERFRASCRRLRRSRSLLVLCFALALAPRVAADDDVVRIVYEAPPGCPTEAQFLRDVLRRVPRVHVAGDEELARRFDVTVTRVDGQSRAELEFVDSDARRARRALTAPDCDEVVASIAVVTALAIDPRLGNLHDEEPSSKSTPAPSAPAAPTPAPRAPAHVERRRAMPGIVAPAPERRRVGSWSLGARAGAVSDTAPRWSPEGALDAELTLVPQRVTGRLAVSYSDSGRLDEQGAQLRFWRVAGHAQICPWIVDLWQNAQWAPCAGFEVGSIHGEGERSTRLVAAKQTTALWLAATLALGVRIELTSHAVLELDGQLRAPILRRTYVVEQPLVVVYETPWLGAGLFAGIRIPFSR